MSEGNEEKRKERADGMRTKGRETLLATHRQLISQTLVTSEVLKPLLSMFAS